MYDARYGSISKRIGAGKTKHILTVDDIFPDYYKNIK